MDLSHNWTVASSHNHKPHLPPLLRASRAALRRLNTWLNRRYDLANVRYRPPDLNGAADLAAAEDALRQLDLPGLDARAYVEKHLLRLARTLTLVPKPRSSSRILAVTSQARMKWIA